MNQLFINGTDYTSDVIEGLDELEIELGLDTTTKTIGKQLSSDITVEGDAYNYLNSFFFANCDSWEKSVKAVFKTSICGGITIECEITSEGVEKSIFKPEITFNLKSNNTENKAFNRLDSELITDNGFIETNETPIHYYVDQPNYLQWALLLLTASIRILFNAVEAILKALCNAITLGFIDDLLGFSCNDINITGAIFSKFDTWITGSGRWAPAPLVREMINYQCQQVGLTFVSSILNDPTSSRYNMSMICLTGGEHGDYKDTSKPEIARVLKSNEPLMTTIDLLRELSTVFNADYRIIGNKIYFERVDFFDKLKTNKLFNIKDVCIEDDVRISYNTQDACAYGDYKYTHDAYDQEGNTTLRFHYQDKVEFNLPYNPAQKGKCTRQINFGPARFMFDKKAYDKRGFFNFIKAIDEFRDGPDSLISDFFFDNEGVIRKYDLVLSSSQLSVHKLLVLENNFDRKDARTIKEPLAKKGDKQYWLYNKPMHMDQLVNDFLFLDNPRLRKDKYKLTDFEIECDCNYVVQSLDNFQTLFIETEIGKAYPENIKILFSDKGVNVNFSDFRVVC
jgi:hypothetical protein